MADYVASPSQTVPWGAGSNRPFGVHSAPLLRGGRACVQSPSPLAFGPVPPPLPCCADHASGAHCCLAEWVTLSSACMLGSSMLGGECGRCGRCLLGGTPGRPGKGWQRKALPAEGTPSSGCASTSMVGPGEGEGVAQAPGAKCCCGKGIFK